MDHEAAHHIPFLKEALIFLVSAGVVVPILQRLGLNSILGYMVAGIAVGPFGLVSLFDTLFGIHTQMVTIYDIEGVRRVAELGVVFLLFVIGLELSVSRLWALRRLVFGAGGAQVGVTSLVIAGCCLAFGLPTAAAVAIGVSLALSSTAIVVQMLIQRGRLASPSGQLMFAILLLQDLAVVPVLLIIKLLAPQEGSLLQSLVISVGFACVAIPAIMILGPKVLGPVMQFIGARRDRDMFTAAALLIILSLASLTAALGLSLALGAFLAGLVFSDTEFRHQLEAEIAPFKGLLLGLFFLGVGMGIDPRIVFNEALTIGAIVIGLMALKAVIIIVIALAFGQSRAIAVDAGLMLSQAGEFSLVGIALALTLGVVPGPIGGILVAAVSMSMALTTALAVPIRRISSALEPKGHLTTQSLENSPAEGHVVIAGFGRVGASIGAMLDLQRIPYAALELDPLTVSNARAKGLPVHFGDARRADILAAAHASSAIAIVLTMDSAAANGAVLQAIRREGIMVPVVVRARDSGQAHALYAQGADSVVLEAFEASLQMGEETLVAAGLPREAAHDLVAERRAQNVASLDGAAKAPAS
ncbi:MAG: cation:proton antiporter [Pseudomonadota bacterium]